jgi:ribulose-5-phosphate 4-epimerase/fuculose-1-phosphate aldolase
MSDLFPNSIKSFVTQCRRIGEHDLLKCSSGNVSQRIDDEHVLATTTRCWIGRLTEDDVAVCRLEDGSVINDKKTTVEFGFHLGILQARDDIDVVLHFQTPAATALACRAAPAPSYAVIPEIPYYIGRIGWVPYIMPGTPELAAAVVEQMRNRDLTQLQNHGQVTVGNGFDHAIQNAEFFELACYTILHNGDSLQPMSDAHANALMRAKEGV